MQYENREAYKCKRCFEWAFVTEGDRIAAAIMQADALDCPYCSTSKGLENVGRVRGAEVVSESERSACDSACTSARGTLCVCKCGSKNHGTGLTIRVTRVEGQLVAVLADISRATRLGPKVLQQIAQYEEAVAKAVGLLESTSSNSQWDALGWRVRWTRHGAQKQMRKANTMKSHAGRMKAINAAITLLEGAVEAIEKFKSQPVLIADEINPAPVAVIEALDPDAATFRQVAFIQSLVERANNPLDAQVDITSLTREDATRYIAALLA